MRPSAFSESSNTIHHSALRQKVVGCRRYLGLKIHEGLPQRGNALRPTVVDVRYAETTGSE
jgi:hypothetical protein